MELSKKEIIGLANHFSINEQELAEYVGKAQKRKVWPVELRWWQDEGVQKVAYKYKYLAPLLIELKNHKALHKERNTEVGVDPFIELGETKEYVLLDLSKSRAGIADRIGCSEKTVGNYIRGLCQCDLMKHFKKGQKVFYSMATWGIMKSDADRREFVPRKIQYLTAGTSSKLLRFKPV